VGPRRVDRREAVRPGRPVWRRSVVVAAAVALAVAAAAFAVPRRHEVAGHSMGPALLPGDVVASGWLPLLDRGRGPRRFERWIVTLPDGTTGLKRVVGLPGETVALEAGDLVIDGAPVVKPPALLAEVGAAIEVASREADGGTIWTRPPAEVLDDAPWAPHETGRLLLPVRDVGLAALVRVGPTAARVRARVGPVAVTWRLAAGATHAVVAGRLDGQVVAVAWPVPEAAAASAPPPARACLPPGAPLAWDVVRPWPLRDRAEADLLAPALALEVPADGPANVGIRRLALWRDVLHRPAADGRDRWVLADTGCLVLGDHPAASRDSRHFGPLPVGALRHRVATAWWRAADAAAASSASGGRMPEGRRSEAN
jgi:type IV secretory pathway protease TraF